MRSLEEADREIEKSLKKELEKAKERRDEEFLKRAEVKVSRKPRGNVAELINVEERIPFF